MKPLKITMTAFGPYKGKEVIDFAELNEHRLFVVSGNTGAGKTSIFDAICFALYGEASGEDRSDSRMLRSHFADDEVHTSVEFEFELKGRVYRVFRQLAHVKAGNKTASGDRYELHEIVKDEAIPLTDRFIVSQVNEKIQQLLGLTKDQFSQIVMLPQGEFRKLLTSETENKEEILRKLFKTSLYLYVAEMLNEKRKNTQKMYDAQVDIRNFYMENLRATLSLREGSELHRVFSQPQYNPHQVTEALDQEIRYLAEQIGLQKAALDAETDQLQKLTAAYHQAQAMNQQFDSLDEKKNAISQLEQQADEYAEKGIRLALAQKAVTLEVYERHYKEVQAELGRKEQQLGEARRELATATESFEAAKLRYAEEEAKSGIREQSAIELERLQGFLPIVSEIDRKQQHIRKLEQEVKSFEEQLKKIEADLGIKQAERANVAEEMNKLDAKLRSFTEQTEKLSKLREQAGIVKEYLTLAEKAETDRENEQQQRKIYEQTEQEYAKLEALWVEGQAGILASHLHDGQPCPVCGGVDHPNKAIMTTEIPSKEQLDQKKTEKTEQEQEYRTRKATLDVTVSLLQAKRDQVLEQGFQLEDLSKQYQQLVETGLALKEEVAQLTKDREVLDQQKDQLQALDKLLESIREQKEEKTQLLSKQRIDHTKEQALFEQEIAGIPEDIRELGKLNQRIQSISKEKEWLDTAWKVAQTQFQETNDRYIQAASNLTNAEKQQAEAKLKLDKSYADFMEALHGAGFATEESYRAAIMTEEARTQLKEAIEQYHSSLHTLRTQIEELEATLQEKERADLAAMQSELELLAGRIEDIRVTLNDLENNHKKGTEGKANILQADTKVKDAEQQFQLVKDLYDVVRGENSKKISFERYLQIEFLEKIIHAANLRLRRISNGQYYLVRSERLEKRGKQSGLGLDVYDNYTGQMRDVKTLSGGEKFNASLCLALGMADVIQSYEGGISLETMFIDEGFGSLDEESLNKAIDTLIDLQQTGRMIGIISHVQELKQAIPAVLEVKKTQEGCSYTRFLVS